MKQLLWSKLLLLLCFSVLSTIGMTFSSAVAEDGTESQCSMPLTQDGPAVPVKYPSDGETYKMTSDSGKSYEFDPTFEDKNGNVGGFYSNHMNNAEQVNLYVHNPHTKEYGVLWGPNIPSSYLEFYDNPDGPGYTWHRIDINGTVIEKGELRAE